MKSFRTVKAFPRFWVILHWKVRISSSFHSSSSKLFGELHSIHTSVYSITACNWPYHIAHTAEKQIDFKPAFLKMAGIAAFRTILVTISYPCIRQPDCFHKHLKVGGCRITIEWVAPPLSGLTVSLVRYVCSCHCLSAVNLMTLRYLE